MDYPAASERQVGRQSPRLFFTGRQSSSGIPSACQTTSLRFISLMTVICGMISRSCGWKTEEFHTRLVRSPTQAQLARAAPGVIFAAAATKRPEWWPRQLQALRAVAERKVGRNAQPMPADSLEKEQGVSSNL
jgi:hypothetical protein